MKAYKELDLLRRIIKSTSKSFGLYSMFIKGKSTFNIVDPVLQDVWILDSRTTNHMALFLVLFNSYFKMT